nr:hypothetical protein [Tanacetum cinerariifolium]
TALPAGTSLPAGTALPVETTTLLVASRQVVPTDIHSFTPSLEESLWVQWIHSYKLQGKNFWDVSVRGNMSWGWRKILQIRPLIREFIRYKIGDGSSISIWFDNWCDHSPLAAVITSRDVFRAGLDLSSKLRDVVQNNVWNWPPYLVSKFPFITSINQPNLQDIPDRLEWQNRQGNVSTFSVNSVWLAIRPRDVKFDWFDVVWFSYRIPRHAFNLWLIMKERLKTQDRVCSWDVSTSLSTQRPLCDLQPDSHKHLFFKYHFSRQVWNHMKCLADLDGTHPELDHIMSIIKPFAKRRSSKSVIAKFVLAACAYFIWQERNARLSKS